MKYVKTSLILAVLLFTAVVVDAEPVGTEFTYQGNFEPDGDVDLADLRLFVDEWLCYCPQGWPLK